MQRLLLGDEGVEECESRLAVELSVRYLRRRRTRIGAQMSESTAATLCRPCGQAAPGMSRTCPHCGSPLATAGPAAAGPATAGGQVPGPASVPGQRAQPQPAGVPAYRFAPARIASGPGLSRRSWLAIGVSGAVVVLAVAAFLVLRPAPPSPGGTVRDYFADLG